MKWGKYNIKPAKYYAGVMHWALWLNGVNFVVYVYVGSNGKRHFFRERGGKHMFHKTEGELIQYMHKKWFRPLVLDTKRLEAYVADTMSGRAGE